MNKVWMFTLLINVALFANLTLDDSEHFSLDKDENISIMGNLHISEETTFMANGHNSISIENDWINNGAFKPSYSSVYFTGLEPSLVKGSTTFYDFIAKKDLTFDSDKIQNITHILKISDSAINSSISGVYAILNLALADIIDVENLIIQDSKIVGRISALNPENSQDGGHNLYWFSTNEICTNIGIEDTWFDKLNCQPEEPTKSTYTSYVIKKSETKTETKSEVSLDEKTGVIVKLISNDSNTLQSLLFTYKSPANQEDLCQRDMQVILKEDGHINTGFVGCGEDDPTLENESDFDIETKVFIRKNDGENISRIIIVDVNLSSKDLIIGGVDAK